MKKQSLEHSQHKLAVFEDKKIRRTFHQGEWFFSIIDIIEVLTGSPNPRRYWSNLKIQLSDNEGFIQLYPKTVQLKLEASDGKKYLTDTANTETLFRMTGLELIFSMLGEAATKEIAVNQDARGFDENQHAAKKGGKIARNARHALEQETGQPVISAENYLGNLIPGNHDKLILDEKLD